MHQVCQNFYQRRIQRLCGAWDVAIQGTITLELLNNVDQRALEYWIHKVQSSGDSTHGTKVCAKRAHNPVRQKSTVMQFTLTMISDFCLQQLARNAKAPVKLKGYGDPVQGYLCSYCQRHLCVVASLKYYMVGCDKYCHIANGGSGLVPID